MHSGSFHEFYYEKIQFECPYHSTLHVKKIRQMEEVCFSLILHCHDLTSFFSNRMRISNDSKICQDYHCAVMNVNRIINCHYLLRNYDVVINCMGLGVDTNLTPIRRQTLKGTNNI